MTTKLLADSDRASLREIIEDNAAWGTTPVTGRTRARRFKSSSITLTKSTVVSDEIRDDRMIASVIETAAESGGDIAWEFAAGTPDMDLQRALMGAWTRPMEWDVFRGQAVSVTDSTHFAIAGGDYSAYFTVGRRVKLSGFANPGNNDYMTVSAVAFASGATTVTITGATLVAEAGNAGSAVCDANDVILLKNTAIRFNHTANTIDSNTANAFATANAAGQLVAGQRIFIEGVGYGKGTITAATVLDGDTVTISDGKRTFTFEAQGDGDITSADYIQFAIGADDTESATNLAAAINATRVAEGLNVAATHALGVVTVIDLGKSAATLTQHSTTLAVVAFTGGATTTGGFYTIQSVSDDALVLDRPVPTIAAGAAVTIKGSMLRNPSNSAAITPQSVSIETGFHDVSQYFLANGLRCGTMELDIASGAIITGSTKIMGRATTRGAASTLANSGSYTVLDSAATEVVSATANVGALVVDGVAASTAIKSIKLSIESNLRNQMAVGNKFPVGIAAGRLMIKGTIEAYFADGEMWDHFLNHDTVSLSFPIVDHDGNTYYFTLPSFKLASSPVSPGGIDQDIMENMEFDAFRDPITKCMIQIDRFSSTTPVTAAL